jgi:hypothetical protein
MHVAARSVGTTGEAETEIIYPPRIHEVSQGVTVRNIAGA